MARIKYFNKKTGKWEYADSQFVSGGNADQCAETLQAITKNMERVTEYSGGNVNLVDENACEFGYVVEGGEIYESTSLKYTPHIPVTEGDVIRFYRVAGDNTTAVELTNMRYLAAFDVNGNAVPSAGVNTAKQSYTVPAGIASIVLTFAIHYTFCITRNKEITEYVPYDPNAVVSETVSYVAKPKFVGMSSENHPGLVRVWMENLDGEMVLHISTEEAENAVQ